ncbi:iron complex outermembrane receptor protein [Mucilaginibacter sp. SG538B]|uniref:SusC/RagA family TonB-linked outer membrane protein n=1 Tax=unclassified Mucilaginibacter TaxID=2617802 RepID=UPI0008712101|nr:MULTISPECIES: SusC/RagA family TonB-linked outer membrane protein [unclassified Mucilaginibacter]NVM64841.1 iron complex outermembrane receptor protein [Mucilaginibacter sp. SG538B]SCW82984.1 iron complex outermembrane recepter protein [Mucilaginibacter sp. NFR10]
MEKNYRSILRLWHRSGKTICLFMLMLMASSAVFAQDGTIKGTVTDESNLPLPGVVVTVKSSGRSTSTNANGAYTVKTSGAGDVLKFTFLGSVPKEVTVGEKNTVNVTMVTDTKQLKDVVVIGYGTASRKDVTGAITSVKAEEFNNGVLTTPAELLQGKVAGLNITKSGDPNKQPATILRGPSTFREGAAQQPFYVIDGVPGASIDLLAPADIESIDVLKDASSTAIYGSRASNGVIIVTTRKAKTGQTRLTYSGYGAVEKVSKNIDVLTADELRKYLADNGVAALSKPTDDDGSNTNWQKLAEKTSYSQNHNLSYGGAGTNSEYGASVNYLKNNGILKNTSLERTIYKGYINQRFFNDRLKLSINLTNSATKNNDIYQSQVLSGILFYLPTVSPFNPDGTYKENYTRTGSGPLNPLSLIDNNFIRTENNKTLINGSAQVDILKGLKFTLTGSTQKEQNNVNIYSTSQSGIFVNAHGVASRSAYTNTSNVVEAYFNYDRVFGQHSLKLLGGYSYQQDRNNDGFGVQTQNFSNDALTYNYLPFSNPTQLSQIIFNPNYAINSNAPAITYISTLRLISFYARAQYQFSDKYLLQASIREDGSSAFGLNTRHGYFPAVSVGWKIISEDFMKSIPVISDLKLRAGYGVSGNSLGFDAFTARLIYGVPPGGGKFLSNGNIVNPIGPVRNDNPDLKWESTGTTNIGLDFGILNNRITGSVDYYVKKTSDLIATYPVSSTLYFYPFYTANVGKIKNNGIEVVINAIPVKSQSFTWRTSFNVSHNKNVVESLSNSRFTLPFIQTAQLGGKGQSGNYSQIIQPGYAIGTFDLWHYMGKNANGVSTYQKADGSVVATQPLTSDQFIKYDAQPKLVYGWSNSFFYKNFDLNFLVRGVYGNKILNATLASLNNPADARLQNIPRFTLGESFKDINAYLISDRFLESGSYLRLDNATLGYTVKPHIQAIKSLRFYASGNNIFIITKYRGVDPEVNIGGLTPGIDNRDFYPKTRTFSLGITAQF